MTSRTKVAVGVIVIASVALFTGYATFDQWSTFVAHLIAGVAP
ncbi:hypothetical protein [Lysobacter sp. HA35]